MSKVFVFALSLHFLLRDMNYNALSLLKYFAMLNHIVEWISALDPGYMSV